jgi:very-short-patch-repair endonuclease
VLVHLHQPYHEILNRHLVLPLLRELRSAEVHSDVEDAGEDGGFRRLYEASQSSFERRVLEEIRKRGLPLPTDAQRTLYDKGGVPIASADFFYATRQLVMFVDGPPHGKDYVASADEKKRKKLKALGYRVLAIRHDHMHEDLSTLKSRL